MKRTRNKYADSDDDMDNLPLKYISTNHKKFLSTKELKMYSLHACEFCEASFKNRYDFLIHNAKHIIIPLIKMLPHPCAECGLYCISEEEMKEHLSVKHNIIVKSKPLRNNDGKTKISDRLQLECDNVKGEPNEDERPLKWLIKKENDIVKQDNVKKEAVKKDIVKKEPDNILQNFMIHCKVDVEKFLPPILCQSDDDKTDIQETCESDYKNHVDAFENSITHNHITPIDDASLKKKLDLKTQTYNNAMKTEVDDFQNTVTNVDSSSEFSDVDEDPIVILAPVKEQVETETVHDSIHFDDLMKPGIFYCKRCFRRFPTRFEVIVHEASHLDLSKTAPTGYREAYKHSKSTVPLSSGPSKQVTTCKRCNEEVSNQKLHDKRCYPMYCASCGKGFKTTLYLMAHEEKCNREAVVNMCDKCLYVRERPEHIKYYGIMKYNNKNNVKRTCHWCAEKSESVSLVTIITKKKTLKDQISFEGEENETVDPLVKSRKNWTNERGPGRAPKFLSNRERLKLIQQRLKSMKK